MRLRTWPLAIIAACCASLFVVLPIVMPEADLPIALLSGVLGGVLVMVWWLLLSRAPWLERIGVVFMIAAGVLATRFAVDASISGGAMGMLGYMLGMAFFAGAVAAWAVAANHLATNRRHLALIASMLVLGVAPMLAIRTAGIRGGGFEFHWRWTPTPEQVLLTHADEDPKPLEQPVASPSSASPIAPVAPAAPVAFVAPATPVALVAPAAPVAPVALVAPAIAEWPGFRGPNRDGVVRNTAIKTDWQQTPPVEMWRRPVGPGWSSFSVRGDLFYTQEQRGDSEIVACYHVSTGEPVWRHRDAIRFYESNGGAGPRGTPTIDGNRVFSMGATGRLNALDASTGKVLWSHNTSGDTKRDVPMWGISSSPLIVDDLVIVSVYGTLAGYDKATGKLRWTGPQHGGSYSSPQLVTEDGVQQVVILSSPGAISVDPRDGSLLWEHKWEGGAIVQPGVMAEGDILINAMAATGGMGTRRLAITHTGDAWSAEERWTSNGLKPYFNDLVVHKGYAYGFDGNILSCIDLADGKRKWKGGRYGNGQLVLLADQDVLLVISEDGELALVGATPDQFKEITRFPALNAKTWNHPVIVRNVLLIRNGEEMAAYRLPIETLSTTP